MQMLCFCGRQKRIAHKLIVLVIRVSFCHNEGKGNQKRDLFFNSSLNLWEELNGRNWIEKERKKKRDQMTYLCSWKKADVFRGMIQRIFASARTSKDELLYRLTTSLARFFERASREVAADTLHKLFICSKNPPPVSIGRPAYWSTGLQDVPLTCDSSLHCFAQMQISPGGLLSILWREESSFRKCFWENEKECSFRNKAHVLFRQ